MRRLASRPLLQARFACARLPRWPALSSVAACLSTDSSNPKGAAGSLEKARRTAHDRASLRTSEGGETQSSDESPTTVPLASLTTHQIANTLRGYARRQERPVDSLTALAAELPRRNNLGFRSLIDSCRALAQLHVVDPVAWRALGDCAEGLISSGTDEATHRRLAVLGVCFAQADHAHRLFTQPDSAYWQRVAGFEEQAAARLVARGVDPCVEQFEQLVPPSPRAAAAELAEPELRQRWRGSHAAVARWTGSRGEMGPAPTGEAGALQPPTGEGGAASDIYDIYDIYDTGLDAAIARYKGRQKDAKVQRRHDPDPNPDPTPNPNPNPNPNPKPCSTPGLSVPT